MSVRSANQRIGHLYLLILTATVVYLLKIGVLPFVMPDTAQYLDGSPVRSPFYTLFLQFDLYVLRDTRFFITFFIQIFAGLFACHYAGKELQSLTGAPRWIGYSFSLLFFTPYFYGDYKFANRLLSEGLSYPLYLFGFSILLRGLVEKQIKRILLFLFILFIMLLTRPQMLFVYPVALIACIYAFMFFKISKKTKALLVISALSTFVFANLIDRTYHYLKHGQFKQDAMLASTFAVPNLFLSKLSDINHIPGKGNKEIFSGIHKKMTALNANIEAYSNRLARTENVYYHFSGSYNPVFWRSLYPTFIEKGITDWYEIDRRSFEIAWPLFKLHWKQYLGFYFFAVRQKMGGYYGVLFYFVCLLLGLVYHLKNRDRLSLLLFFITLTSFANYTSIALFQPILRRYAIYTETFQVCLMISIVYLAIQNRGKVSIAE